jgi:hypothetical protein
VLAFVESFDFDFSETVERYYVSDLKLKLKQAPWPESASEIYRPIDLRLLKLVPSFADRL